MSKVADRLIDVTLPLRQGELEAMERFYGQLDAPSFDAERITDESFAAIVTSGIDRHGVKVEALCDRFGLNRSTVSRWKSGRSAPQPFARPAVVNWIKEDVRTRMDRLSGELGM